MAKYTCDLLGIPRDLLYEIEELLKYIKDNPQSRNANEHKEAVRLKTELFEQIEIAETT